MTSDVATTDLQVDRGLVDGPWLPLCLMAIYQCAWSFGARELLYQVGLPQERISDELRLCPS